MKRLLTLTAFSVLLSAQTSTEVYHSVADKDGVIVAHSALTVEDLDASDSGALDGTPLCRADIHKTTVEFDATGAHSATATTLHSSEVDVDITLPPAPSDGEHQYVVYDFGTASDPRTVFWFETEGEMKATILAAWESNAKCASVYAGRLTFQINASPTFAFARAEVRNVPAAAVAEPNGTLLEFFAGLPETHPLHNLGDIAAQSSKESESP